MRSSPQELALCRPVEEKRGFLSYALGANPRTKEKESPHVEHDTLPATPRPRPPALFLRPVLRHPLPTPPGLGPVRRAAQPLPRRPDPPRRHRSLPRPAPSLRSLLQLFQPRRLVRPSLRPAPGYQRYPALEDPRSLVPSRGRHPAAQARPTRLRPGLVPGRGGLDTQACRHGFGQQLGRAGLGRPHPLVVGLLLVSAVGLPPEDAGPWATRLRRAGAGTAGRSRCLVPQARYYSYRGRGLRQQDLAHGPAGAGDVCGPDALGCSGVRTDAGGEAEGPTRPEGQARP